MASLALAVMAKAPQAGRVKTRLCPPLSPAEAAAFARCCLLDTLAKVRTLPAVPVLTYTPASQRQCFAAMAPDFTLLPQPAGDLGRRMAHCFRRLFARGFSAVLLMGSDLPTLPVAYLRHAMALLEAASVDLVLGPSEDGGYYLIGLRQLHEALFTQIPWSSAGVLQATLQRAAAHRLRVACLPAWYDVDTPAELARLRTELAHTHPEPPFHTSRFVLEHATRLQN